MAPAVGNDTWLDQLRLQASKARSCALFVRLDQSGVADHVGSQDRRQSPLNTFLGHASFFPRESSEFYVRPIVKSIEVECLNRVNSGNSN